MHNLRMFVNFVLALGLLIATGTNGGAHAQKADWTWEQQAVIDAVKNNPLGIESDFETWAEGYTDDWTYWRVGDKNIRLWDTHMALVREFIDAAVTTLSAFGKRLIGPGRRCGQSVK